MIHVDPLVIGIATNNISLERELGNDSSMTVRRNTYLRRDVAERMLDVRIYETPDPRRVYELSLKLDFDLLAERFGWLDRKQVGRLVSQGRAMSVGGPGATAKRALTPDQQREVVAAVHELGGVTYAARAYGLGEYLVRTLVLEHNGTYPRASRKPADIAAAAAWVEAFRARRTA